MNQPVSASARTVSVKAEDIKNAVTPGIQHISEFDLADVHGGVFSSLPPIVVPYLPQ